MLERSFIDGAAKGGAQGAPDLLGGVCAVLSPRVKDLSGDAVGLFPSALPFFFCLILNALVCGFLFSLTHERGLSLSTIGGLSFGFSKVEIALRHLWENAHHVEHDGLRFQRRRRDPVRGGGIF